jgi:hypothetical protein
MRRKIVYGTVLAIAVLTISMFAFGVSKVKAGDIIGDLNGDGVVDLQDVAVASQAFNTYPGHPRWNPLADLNGDSEIDSMDMCIIAHLIGKKVTEVTVELKILPCVLNLKSKGKWITAIIEFPEGYLAGKVDISSILLNGTVRAESKPCAFGDFDGDGKEELMVKFDRKAVIKLIVDKCKVRVNCGFSRVTLTVTGRFSNRTPFKGSATVKIISTKCRSD